MPQSSSLLLIILQLLATCAAVHGARELVADWAIQSAHSFSHNSRGSSRTLLEPQPAAQLTVEEKRERAAQVLSGDEAAIKEMQGLQVKEVDKVSFIPPGCLVEEEGARNRRTKILVSGADHAADSADDCMAACKARKRCNSWFWCNDKGGCQNEYGASFPMLGCQLERQKLTPGTPPFTWAPSKFAAGYHGVIGSSQLDSPEKRAVLITTLPKDPCPLSYGFESLQQAFINKHEYARIHSYEFQLTPVPAEHMSHHGTWYRLWALQQALNSTSAERAEWILFTDQDTLIDDMAFAIPFERYEGKDIVMWGDEKLVADDQYQPHLSAKYQDNLQGLDTAVMLVRNTQWSREFFAKVMTYWAPGRRMSERKQQIEQELVDGLTTWEPLKYEQNVVAYLLKDAATRTHVFFENDYCLNCPWFTGPQGRTPFIKRFVECDYCYGTRASVSDMYECTAELRKTFAFGNRMALEMLGCGHEKPTALAALATSAASKVNVNLESVKSMFLPVFFISAAFMPFATAILSHLRFATCW